MMHGKWFSADGRHVGQRCLVLWLLSAFLLPACLLAADGRPHIWSDLPSPSPIITDGGFELDDNAVFIKGGFTRDVQDKVEGNSSALKTIDKDDTPGEFRFYQGSVTSGMRYVISGMLKTDLTPDNSDGRDRHVGLWFLTFTQDSDGKLKLLKNYRITLLRGLSPWRHFHEVVELPNEVTAVRLSVNWYGKQGDRFWIDDLYCGPYDLPLRWDDGGGTHGLCQAQRADGASFEYAIPRNAEVLAVFQDGQRLQEGGAGDYVVLYPVKVVRFLAIPPAGVDLTFVLKPFAPADAVTGHALARYFLLDAKGQASGWYPEALADFRTPRQAVTALDPMQPLSSTGLPGQVSLTTPPSLTLAAPHAGYYSLRLYDAQGQRMSSPVESRKLPAGGTLRTAMPLINDAGQPLPAGAYIWELLRYPITRGAVLGTRPVPAGAVRMWERDKGFSFVIREDGDSGPRWSLLHTDAHLQPVGTPQPIPVGDLGDIVEARDGTLFAHDRKARTVVAFRNGKPATDFSAQGVMKDIGIFIGLALDGTGEQPYLFIAHGDPKRPRGVMKFTLKGEPIADFGTDGAAAMPDGLLATAVTVLPDGNMLVGAQGENAWVLSLDRQGALLPRFRRWRGDGLRDRFLVEDSEEAYSYHRGVREQIGMIVDTRYRQVSGIHVGPGDDLYVTAGYVREPNREIQVYSPAGELLYDIGRGPQLSFSGHSSVYPRTWDTREVDRYGDIQGVTFTSDGQLLLLDAKHGRLEQVQTRVEIARKPVKVTGSARAVTAQTPLALTRTPYAPLPAGFSLADLKQRHGLDCTVADFIDLSDARPGRGLRDDGTMSIIRRPGVSPYRLSGTEHCAWFRAKMEVPNPGRPHLLLVEYPDDTHRWTMLTVRHDGQWTAGNGVDWLGVEGGYATGWGFPLTGHDQQYTLLVYPRRPWLTLYFKSFAHGGLPACRDPEHNYPGAYPALYGAAASKVWLLEVQGDLPANPVEEPRMGEKRLVGDHRQHTDTIYCDFGGVVQEQDLHRRGIGYIHREWTKTTYANLFSYFDYLGFNYFDNVAYDENGRRMYPSEVFKTHMKEYQDAVSITLDASAKQQMAVTFTFFGLQGIPDNRPDLKDKVQVSERGEPSKDTLSLAYPEVQQYFIDLVTEMAKLHKDDPNFMGVTLMMNFIKTPLFHPRMGYEDQAIRLFTESTSMAVKGNTTRERAKYIHEHCLDAWVEWRCEFVYQWVLRLRDAVHAVRPDLMVIIYPTALPAYLGYVDGKYHGFDRERYRHTDGLHLYELKGWPGYFMPYADNWMDLSPREPIDMLEFAHGYFETRTRWHEQTAGTLAPNKSYITGPFITQFLRYNPRVIALHSWVRATVGFDLEFREFVRAFRSLPYAPSRELSGVVPAEHRDAVKVFRYGPAGPLQYLAVVNTSAHARTFTLTVPGATGTGAVRDLVAGADLPGRKSGEVVTVKVSVPAYNMRTYRIGE
jgi:hypothetical protein